MTTKMDASLFRTMAYALAFLLCPALAGGQAVARAADPLPLLDPPASVLSVPASLSDTQGTFVDVPISVAPGDGILGVDMTLTYDPSVLQVQSVTCTGIAAADGFSLVANSSAPGSVVIALYATGAPLSGSGEIASVRFQVIGTAGATSPLAFTAASLNEGQIPVVAGDGVFNVLPTITILSMPGDVQGGPGSLVQVPITASAADGAYGIDMTLQYDPGVLQPGAVTVTGIAAAAGFAVVANTTVPGVIPISLYATSGPLAGSGEILHIAFTIVGGPGSWSDLTFSGASINEGAMPVGFINGLVRVTCAGAADGTACNDGDPATCADACSGGVCAGTPVAEPPEVNDSLRLTQSGADADLGWDDLPGPFNVYRGEFGIGGEVPFIYNHACFNAGGPLAVQGTTDTETPPVGWVFYYLVTRVDQCRESIPGRDSAGTPIPNAHACFAP
jgi:hypothetical protein